MAEVNIEEWSPDDVAEWVKGLGSPAARYAEGLRARGVTGKRLLLMRGSDAEDLGVGPIGHQELLLEAIEQLREFQYSDGDACASRLALLVSARGGALARLLRGRGGRGAGGADGAEGGGRLDTGALADVAGLLAAVKPLVCWLDRWALIPESALGSRRAALLRLSLEAATCAQRDRFAEAPARCVAAAAAAAAAVADYVLQEAREAGVCAAWTIEPVSVRGARWPAWPAAALTPPDKLLQVGSQVVVGWCASAISRLCASLDEAGAGAGAGAPAVVAWVRRRGGGAGGAPAATPAPLRRPRRPHHYHAATPWELDDLRAFKRELDALPARRSPAPAPPALTPTPPEEPLPSSDEDLTPPHSPSQLHSRMFPARPGGAGGGGGGALRRRHTVAACSRRYPHDHIVHQFWRELARSAWPAEEGEDEPYRRDKAQSVLALPARAPPALTPALTAAGALVQLRDRDEERSRGKLDKAHSTPAYDFNGDEPGPLVTQVIPESPAEHPPPGAPGLPADSPAPSPAVVVHSAEKADQILGFKKSSTQIAEAIQHQHQRRPPADGSRFPFDDGRLADEARLIETINIAMVEHQRAARPPPPAPDARPPIPAEHVRCIQDEIVQALGGKAEPPEPPPRPPAAAASPHRPLVREPPAPPPDKKAVLKEYPPLRCVPPAARAPPAPPSPLQLPLPLKHISKHDIRMVPSARRPLPPLNAETDLATAPTPAPPRTALSPTPTSGKGLFPSSKTKGLKKKNSILAKRRNISYREAEKHASWAEEVYQRVRVEPPAPPAAAQAGPPPSPTAPSWLLKHALLVDRTLLLYSSKESARADVLAGLPGAAVCYAREVRSRPHAFKVYVPGRALYLAPPSAAAAHAALAALAPLTHHQADEAARQFSETDCSEDSADERPPAKSKFNSLKKFTHRMHRSDAGVGAGAGAGAGASPAAGAASLDRKYLRFFTRTRTPNEKHVKAKHAVAPVPTEHYRSYRRIPPPESSSPASPASPATPDTVFLEAEKEQARNKLPKPINYIHASNPNLLDFEKSDFVTRPLPAPAPPAPRARLADTFIGFVTLEEFMLKKQEEERQQVYNNRVLMGIERDRKEDRACKKAAKELQKQLDQIVPDVIYGELPSELPEIQARSLPAAPAPAPAPAPADRGRAISVKGKDGYEKIVYTNDKSPQRAEEPPRVLPRRPPRRASEGSPDLRRKSSLTTAKDLGYEVIYDEDAAASAPDGDAGAGAEGRAPPPVMPKSRLVLDRQTSLNEAGGGPGAAGGAGGVDCSPVFLQGDSPEKFWLNSLRRNDKVHSGQAAASRSAQSSPAKRDDQQSSHTSSIHRLLQRFGGGGGGGGGGGVGGGGGGGGGVVPGGGGGGGEAACAQTRPSYPHLQCPPTFEPETYCLAALVQRPD